MNPEQLQRHAATQLTYAQRNREKVNAWNARNRQLLRERVGDDDPTVEHGRSEATYAAGCRCVPCKDVAAERRASRRAKARS